jgi:outer membrane protein assembly factor BamB
MFSALSLNVMAQQSSKDWPMFHADASHSSVGEGSPVLIPMLLWSYTTGNIVASSPAVVGGVVYIGSGDGNVYALNAATGSKLWNFSTRGPVYSSPAVVSGVVYVGSFDDNVYALKAATGSKIWSYTTGGPVDSSPTVVGGVVYIGSFDDNVYALGALPSVSFVIFV